MCVGAEFGTHIQKISFIHIDFTPPHPRCSPDFFYDPSYTICRFILVLFIPSRSISRTPKSLLYNKALKCPKIKSL